MDHKNAIAIGLLGFILSLMSPIVVATEQLEPVRFWGGVDIGGGNVQRSSAGVEVDETNFFLGFKGGYILDPQFLIGLELSGWLIEASNLNDHVKGEGISQVFLIARLYPSVDYNFFAKIGGGYVSHWRNQPGGTIIKSGQGLTLGGGYDFSLNDNQAITPIITYSFGETGGEKHNIITLSIGISLQY